MLEFDETIMDPHPERSPTPFYLAVELSLEIDDGPGNLVHTLRHRPESAAMMTLSALVSGARANTS